MLGKSAPLDVAVRAWAVEEPERKRRRAGAGFRPQDLGPSPWSLTFDTETALDTGQGLRVGGYQLRRGRRVREEGIFYEPDALTDDEHATLGGFCEVHGLALRSRESFVEDVFLKTAWDRRGLIVGHNLPFDIARIAIAHRPCQSRDKSMRGGFSHTLSRDTHKSHVQIKRINAGGAFIRLTIPSGISLEKRNRANGGGMPDHHGYFLDTATLGGALLGGRPSLKRLAKLLGTATQKGDGEHGEKLTPVYLDYLRDDVKATHECAQSLLERYAAYDVPKGAWEIYSEAGIGKAHLDKTGLTPFRTLNNWPEHVYASVMETYYGGRTEVMIRRQTVPGVYADFTSQYPTAYALQNLRRYLQASEVTHAYEDPAIVQRLLDQVTVEDVLDRTLWPQLDALVLVVPDRDRLPTRARYARRSIRRQVKKANRSLNVALPYRTGGPAQWWTLADCISSKLMTDKAPRAITVLRFQADDEQKGLGAIDIAGQAGYRVDPNTDDLIARLVEHRQDARAEKKAAQQAGNDARAATLDATQQAMKATTNASSYGSSIEMNPIEHRKPVWVNVHRPDNSSYRVSVNRTERPGSWFCPLIATLVSAGGRLLLACAMRLVADAGGVYAFCDTDSLFIVAAEHGGLIACPGGPRRTPEGEKAVLALSWQQADAIIRRFASLNPYRTIAGSILKTEEENFDPDTGQQRQIECYAIASKRYGLFTRPPDGAPVLVTSGDKLKRSEHGLGHLLPPNAPTPDLSDRAWLDAWWQHLLRVELGHPSAQPDWFDEPAVGRLSIGSPRDLKSWSAYNTTRPYSQQVKPGNFLTLAHPHPHERARPDGPRCLIAPFERDPERRRTSDWTDRDRPGAPTQRIRTDRPYEIRTDSTAVLSYADYFDNYRQHPETKAFDPADGQPCHTWTRGLLQPWHITASGLQRVGKESNRLADTHLQADEEEQIIDYPAPTRTCRGCDAQVAGRRQWCSDACRKRAYRSTRQLTTEKRPPEAPISRTRT